jgi:demethylmenaquinone methyltransferase/2-methoxy-6-polyprenyl-1,4-benzoquinol methylase
MTIEPSRGAPRSEREVRAMFGRITRRYDLMNRVMTGGRDRAWRRLAVRSAVGDGVERAIDVATGTGDLALALAAGGAASVIGVDFAEPMLRVAAGKVAPATTTATGGRSPVGWVTGDALRLPLPDASFDACTVAFGLRNMADYEGALREMARVLRPGGRLVCLELTPFRRPVVSSLFNFYFTRVVPLVGGLLSGDRDAYRYLPRSVTTFPDAEALGGLFRAAGLIDVRVRSLGGGTVALHSGTKPH